MHPVLYLVTSDYRCKSPLTSWRLRRFVSASASPFLDLSGQILPSCHRRKQGSHPAIRPIPTREPSAKRRPLVDASHTFVAGQATASNGDDRRGRESAHLSSLEVLILKTMLLGCSPPIGCSRAPQESRGHAHRPEGPDVPMTDLNNVPATPAMSPTIAASPRQEPLWALS
jgi:hypothetical protein